jgi:hypothetical protein
MEPGVAFNALKRTSRSVLLVCAMTFGALPVAYAEENVLIESVPANVEKAAALTAVREALKEMLDKGLITADEYAHKKDEILKGL